MRYVEAEDGFEQRLVTAMQAMADDHPFYGYKKIWALLKREGWNVNRKRIERLWRLHGLTQPLPQASGKPAEGSAENAVWKVKAQYPNHVWALDFVTDRTRGGKRFRVLNVIDEFTREAIYSGAERSVGATRVRAILAELVRRRGAPTYLRSDNGREFIAGVLAEFLEDRGVQALFIEKGRPQQNGICERFNGLMRNELLNAEEFGSLLEANVLIHQWVDHFNCKRPHSALAHLTPREFRLQWKPADVVDLKVG
jgi:putative transposase